MTTFHFIGAFLLNQVPQYVRSSHNNKTFLREVWVTISVFYFNTVRPHTSHVLTDWQLNKIVQYFQLSRRSQLQVIIKY